MRSINTKKLLKQLISIPSPYFSETEIAEFLESLLKLSDFKTSRQEVFRQAVINGETKEFRHFNVLGEKGEGKRSFLLYGHIDTVAPVNAWYEMDLNPYNPTEKEDKIYGLGASDMKAGVAAILKAVEKLEPKDYRLKICFGIDEENESKGALTLINSDFLKDCAGCIVPEVGSGRAVPAVGNLVIGRHGRNRVGIKITGRAAHASTPEFIVNPIKYTGEVIEITDTINLGNDSDMPPGNVSMSGIIAESSGLSSPEECVIWFDNLYSPPMTSASILEQYRGICQQLNKKYRITSLDIFQNHKDALPNFKVIDPCYLSGGDEIRFTKRTTPYMEPWKIEKEHQLVGTASNAVKKILNKEPTLTCGNSNADENYIGQIIPTIVIPPLGANEHQAGEYIIFKSVDKVAEIIAETISEYMKLEINLH